MADRIRLCAADEIEPGTARRFDVGSYQVALVRIDEDFYAVGDRCTHEDYSLSEGEIDEEECDIECPKHGSLFSLQTGEALTLPATQPVPVYEVVREGPDVWLVSP